MGKFALLIGVSEYVSGLQPLPKAVLDVEKLAQILNNPEIGGFEKVDVLKNPERQPMEVKIEEFLADSGRDDLLLLYFSGHGVVDEAGNFYLSSRSTSLHNNQLRTATAVKARDIHAWMSNCKAKRQAVILDCCNAGAFAKGLTTKDVGKIDIKAQLGGEGRAVLTAATSTQYAFEQEGLDLSIYTHYLVEGLEKGAADLNDDGQISVEELHEYVFKKVKEAAPAMTPEIYNLARDTEPILIARSPKDDPVVKYRKEVRKLAEEDEGEFGYINRCYLDDFQKELRLDPPITQAIETEELEPYRQRKAKEARYREVFSGAIQHRYPLTPKDHNGLERLQKLLSLRDEDVNRIEQTILHERQLPPPPTQPSPPSPAVITPVTKTITFASEKDIDYTKLRDLLAAGDWQAADYETYLVMLQAVGRKEGDYLRSEELRNFPCTDLKTIDNLWRHYSKGKWGFSVQKQIWQQCGSPTEYNKDWEKFGECVGWRKGEKWLFYDDLAFDLEKSHKGEFPFLVVFGFFGRRGLLRFLFSSLALRLVDCSTRQS